MSTPRISPAALGLRAMASAADAMALPCPSAPSPAAMAKANAGPLEIPRIFLGSAAEFPPEHVEKLRQKMREFVLGCHAGPGLVAIGIVPTDAVGSKF